MVATHLDFIDRFLHHHHTTEDDLLWPKLLERVPNEIAPMVELMKTQHHVVAHLLGHTVTRRAAWRKTASPADAAILADAYAQLHVSLVEHLDAEGLQVMPLVEGCITQKEWDAIGKQAQRFPAAQGRPAHACHARLRRRPRGHRRDGREHPKASA